MVVDGPLDAAAQGDDTHVRPYMPIFRRSILTNETCTIHKVAEADHNDGPIVGTYVM